MINSINRDHVVLLDAELLRRRRENRKYLMELDSDKLLIHHRAEAGIDTRYKELGELHDGWENPLCQLRGHFLGHWLSAAAMEYAVTSDREVLAKAEAIVAELARCQQANGGEWCASIPEKYLTLIAKGETIWAPQYTIHKTFMGLLDLYEYAGTKQALDLVVNFSKWFYHWSTQFSAEEFGRILDVETGGMLEIWAQLYGATKESMYLELMDKYYRHSLFDGLLAGKDVLTNMHANTTIPEALGAARAYEVTGGQKWLDIVKAYWDQAVTQRGQYCTGGQTNGEIWTPKMSLAARLGEKNQEHCTVYNLMRLADFLFRNTGDVRYADYWELNLYNGIMAQAYYHNDRLEHGEQSPFPTDGLLTYFLPLKSGGKKAWASKTKHFFCCHGSLVQANAGHVNGIYYQDQDCVYVCQYFASDVTLTVDGKEIRLMQRGDTLSGNGHMVGSMTGSQTINPHAAAYPHNPQTVRNHLTLECGAPVEFTLKLRKPWWHKGELTVSINGKAQSVSARDGFLTIDRLWSDGDEITFDLHREITVQRLPDAPLAAFLIGPVVLAGLCQGQTLYAADPDHPEAILVPDNEREWATWKSTFRTTGQERDIAFMPLYQVGYEQYSVYFPIKA